MAQLVRFGGATALATILATSPAFADLTAQDVWSDWRGYIGGLGYDVSATEATDGDTLKITNLMINVVLPEDEGTAAVNMGEINLRDNGDGTVTWTMPSTTPLTVNVRPTDDKPVDVQIDLNQTGLNMVVSGSPGDMNYSYSAVKLAMTLASLVVDGKPMDNVATFDMVMENLIGQSKMQVDELRHVSQKMSVDSVSYNFSAADPEGSGNMKFVGGWKDISFEGAASIPLDIDPENPEDMFAKGFAFAGAYEFGNGSTEFFFIENGEAVQFNSKSDAGELAVSMDATRMEYAGSTKGLSVNMSGGDIPFPISAEVAEAGFAMQMPIGASDEPQDFGIAVSVIDFAVPDMLWSIADPQSILPRGPATVALDLTGSAKLLANLMDPEVMNSPAPPGELHSLKLGGLVVSVAGAELTGEGDFTFDNSDLQTFGGVPRPTGAVDLQLVGGNGLLDNLVKMQIIPEDEAMQARMMMGLFAVPGDGEDTLNSTLEVNEQGHVLANGQRIQ